MDVNTYIVVMCTYMITLNMWTGKLERKKMTTRATNIFAVFFLLLTRSDPDSCLDLDLQLKVILVLVNVYDIYWTQTGTSVMVTIYKKIIHSCLEIPLATKLLLRTSV